MSDISEEWSAKRIRRVIDDHYEPDQTDENDSMYCCTRCGQGGICVAFDDETGTPKPATLEAIIPHEEEQCPNRDDAI